MAKFCGLGYLKADDLLPFDARGTILVDEFAFEGDTLLAGNHACHSAIDYLSLVRVGKMAFRVGYAKRLGKDTNEIPDNNLLEMVRIPTKCKFSRCQECTKSQQLIVC